MTAFFHNRLVVEIEQYQSTCEQTWRSWWCQTQSGSRPWERQTRSPFVIVKLIKTFSSSIIYSFICVCSHQCNGANVGPRNTRTSFLFINNTLPLNAAASLDSLSELNSDIHFVCLSIARHIEQHCDLFRRFDSSFDKRMRAQQRAFFFGLHSMLVSTLLSIKTFFFLVLSPTLLSIY